MRAIFACVLVSTDGTDWSGGGGKVCCISGKK